MEWISTEAKMPEDGARVLLYTPYRFFGDYHSCIGNRQSIRTCTTKLGKKTVPVFTHWMPLPAMPASR